MSTTSRPRRRHADDVPSEVRATMAWRVRVVRTGDRYGPRGALRHTGPEAFVELHPEHAPGLRRCARRLVDDLYVAPLARPLLLDAHEGWELVPGQLIALLEWLDRPDAGTAFLAEGGRLHARRAGDTRLGLRRPLPHPPGGHRRWDEPASPTVLERMIDALMRAGPSAHAGDPEGEALFWMEARLSAAEAAAWLGAGVEDPRAAQSLRALGLPPEAAARRPPAGTVAPGGHRFDGHESIADAVRAGVVTPVEAHALRVAPGPGAHPDGGAAFPAGCWT